MSTFLKWENESKMRSEVYAPLISDIEKAAEKSGVVVTITTARSDHNLKTNSGNISRHSLGQAVDIAIINGIGNKGAKASAPGNQQFLSDGEKFVRELQNLGYARNIESGNSKAVLFKTKGHWNHIHVSNNGGKVNSSGDGRYPTGEAIQGGGYDGGIDKPTGLKYLHFDPDFIERGIKLYKEYFNKDDIESYNDSKDAYSDVGFIPLTLNMKLDGISGWVIYDKVRINQEILPPQYPKGFEFVIMGISHNIENNDWVTDIETLSIYPTKEKKWNYHQNSLVKSPYPINPAPISNIPLSPDKEKYMGMVYQAFINAGFNKNQAKYLTAEVGRENDYNPKCLFGYHWDSGRWNLGMMSWNGIREYNLKKFAKDDEFQGGSFSQSQKGLDVQARFVKHEIGNSPEYIKTKQGFLNNPNVDNKTARELLGRNYIRYAMNSNNISRRDSYLNQINQKYT